ncbi:MAG: hypothetical protein ACRCYU_23615 [Nocardioides sp.]
MTPVADWLERHVERVAVRQRAQVETTKLVTTFATGVAATVVATALQAAGTSPTETRATSLLGLSAILAVLTIVADRLAEADHEAIVIEASVKGWSDQELIAGLRTAQIQAALLNEGVVSLARRLAGAQVLVATAAGVMGVLSL